MFGRLTIGGGGAPSNFHRRRRRDLLGRRWRRRQQSVIGCLRDLANVQQTSSKSPALHLLEVCWTFAGSCKHPHQFSAAQIND